MRADRLVQLLLFLQRRPKVTVAEVAAELEISTRTARRDLEALAMSGIPVYSQAGRGGGWSLLGGATTDLSGLTEAEVRALFVVAAGSNGLDPQLRAALRKLTSALPEPFRAGAEVATQSIIVDADSWGSTSRESARPDAFDTVADALLTERQLRIEYVNPGGKRTDRVVHPLGLIEKRGRWYLVTSTDSGLRTFRLDRVQTAERLEAAAVRPPDFDLESAWTLINERFAENTLIANARLEVLDPTVMPALRGRFGRRLDAPDEDPSQGPFEVRLGAWSPEALAAELSGFGNRVRVIEPAETIVALKRLAAELQQVYGV